MGFKKGILFKGLSKMDDAFTRNRNVGIILAASPKIYDMMITELIRANNAELAKALAMHSIHDFKTSSTDMFNMSHSWPRLNESYRELLATRADLQGDHPIHLPKTYEPGPFLSGLHAARGEDGAKPGTNRANQDKLSRIRRARKRKSNHRKKNR